MVRREEQEGVTSLETSRGGEPLGEAQGVAVQVAVREGGACERGRGWEGGDGQRSRTQSDERSARAGDRRTGARVDNGLPVPVDVLIVREEKLEQPDLRTTEPGTVSGVNEPGG